MTVTPDRIVLTADIELREKLVRKKAEYKRRYAFQAPEVCPIDTYKMRILTELLEKGSLDVNDRRSRAYKEDDFFHTVSFNAAVKIITAYNADDLTRLRGGTGLR